jgi:deoxyadenosine/deoxycytidine kinase
MSKPLIISIEGNIGSGKSTFIKKLEEYWKTSSGLDEKKIFFLSEPVDEWLNIKDENDEHILSKFYNDQEKYSFTFQMMAYISRLNKLKEAIDLLKLKENAVIITERSLMTDKYVFAQMLYDEKKIEKIEFDIYNKWFDSFNKETQIDKVVYISSNPNVCFDRVKLRDRNGESNIPLDYLTKCSEYHDNMIKKVEQKNIDTIMLDGNNNIFKDNNVLLDWFKQIENIINETENNSLYLI